MGSSYLWHFFVRGGQDSPLVSVLAFDLLPGGQALPPSLAPSLHRSSESRGGHDSPLATFSSSSSAEYTGASVSPRAPAKGSRARLVRGGVTPPSRSFLAADGLHLLGISHPTPAQESGQLVRGSLHRLNGCEGQPSSGALPLSAEVAAGAGCLGGARC